MQGTSFDWFIRRWVNLVETGYRMIKLKTVGLPGLHDFFMYFDDAHSYPTRFLRAQPGGKNQQHQRELQLDFNKFFKSKMAAETRL
jgi:hypothetical protein